MYQEQRTKNVIFPIYDRNNNMIGKEVQVTQEPKHFKVIKNKSKCIHGFNVGFGDDNTYAYALFFESVIDLMR